MSRYRYSFTGPARLSPDEDELVWETVRSLLEPAEFTTGACTGWDMAVARAAVELWPSALHRVIVPAAGFDAAGLLALVDETPGHVRLEVVYPESIRARDPYRDRNTALVARADALIARVRRPTFYRSGEWMSVGIARRAGVPVEFALLPGEARP